MRSNQACEESFIKHVVPEHQSTEVLNPAELNQGPESRCVGDLLSFWNFNNHFNVNVASNR
jgi:hypothetical protein